jgi:hypothetical protein
MIYEYVREDVLGRDPDGAFPLHKAIPCAMFSGGLAQFLSNPTDLVKVRVEVCGLGFVWEGGGGGRGLAVGRAAGRRAWLVRRVVCAAVCGSSGVVACMSVRTQVRMQTEQKRLRAGLPPQYTYVTDLHPPTHTFFPHTLARGRRASRRA